MSVQDISNFLKLNKLDQQTSNINDFKNLHNKQDTAQYINKNINKMDDIEKKNLLLTLLDDKKVSSELLKYELKYLDLDKKISDLNEFTTFVRNSLERYHMKAGGYLCEDTEWSEFYPNSDPAKYPLKQGEVLFENSIKRVNRYDIQIVNYITDLLNFFNRHSSDTLYISYKQIASTDGIYWMVIKIVNLDIKNQKS